VEISAGTATDESPCSGRSPGGFLKSAGLCSLESSRTRMTMTEQVHLTVSEPFVQQRRHEQNPLHQPPG
jgi:hypothetical protein